jgi:inner membrane protein
MPTFGHLIFGAAAARVYAGPEVSALAAWRSVLFGAGLAILPDADFLCDRLGLGEIWSHRGATHAVLPALAFGALLGWAAGTLGLPRLRTAVFACVALLSHGLLDTLTDCRTGCALLWPFGDGRYLAGWRPVPAVPVEFGHSAAAGIQSALVELAWFSPLLLFALLPHRRRQLRARP